MVESGDLATRKWKWIIAGKGKLGEKQNVIEDKVQCIMMHIYERAREQSRSITCERWAS